MYNVFYTAVKRREIQIRVSLAGQERAGSVGVAEERAQVLGRGAAPALLGVHAALRRGGQVGGDGGEAPVQGGAGTVQVAKEDTD